MPAPKSPNTAAATAAVRRRGQETMATKLRAAGWVCVPPEVQHKPDYGAPGCDCPYPEKVSESCPLHGA